VVAQRTRQYRQAWGQHPVVVGDENSHGDRL
jgi:hypothetical protein